jgi:crossover junction endodeoxyribonuclease RuvC
MLVIGIDPGTATTGYGLVQDSEDSSLSIVDYGVILTTPDHSGAVEKLFFQRNVKTAISVGQARGVALLALAELNLPVAEYTPLEVKQAVAGYGGADKNQVQQMVRALLNLETIPHPDDAADALAIAICHLHTVRIDSIYRSSQS